MRRRLATLSAVLLLALGLLGIVACGAAPSPENPAASPTADSGPAPAPLPTPAVQPEIEALAEGLDNDPRLIYAYVLNSYDAVPVYGLMKNSRDTYYSKRGNPFDLAVLLSDLLRAAGYQTEFVVARIEVPLADALNWVGAEIPPVLSHVLNVGGIYNEMIGADVVRMKHVWVRANIDGTWYALDPSFKPYAYSQGIDLVPILGYTRDTHLAGALAGATVTAEYARNINTASISSNLTQYATNLAQYLRDNMPFASLADVVGGRRIVTQTIDALPSRLPYDVETVLGTFADLPSGVQYSLHVELPGLDYWTPVPEVAGDRITVSYVGATSADRDAVAAAGGIDGVYPARNVEMVPELRIGGELIATGEPAPLGSSQTMSVTVRTPYSIDEEPVIWQGRPKRLTVGAFYAFSLSLEGVSEDALQRHYDLLEDYRAAGLADESEPVRGESLYLIGAAYANQVEACGRLDAALARVVFFPQMLGVYTSQNLLVTEWDSAGDTQQPERVAWGSYGIDVSFGSRTVRSAQGLAQDTRAFQTHLEQRASAAEHAVLEQLQGHPAWSTVKAMVASNAESVRIYRLASDNIEALLPNLDLPSWMKDELQQQVTQGRVVIAPERRVHYHEYYGTGYWSFDPDSGILGGLISGGLVTPSGHASEPAAMLGGDSTEDVVLTIEELIELMLQGINAATDCNQGCNNPDTDADNNAGEDPVDTATGAFLHQTTDLSFGTLGRPISFVRTYVSERRNVDGPLGYGWTHSYALRLATSSDWARGLGYRTAMDAVAAIAEAYVGIDQARAPAGELTLAQLLAGTAGANWSTAQVIDNVVTVTGAQGEHHQYLRLADGRYQPGHHDYSTLARNGDGTYTVADKTGGRAEFDTQGRGIALVDADGNRTTLTYDAQGQLTRVTDAAGRAIHLSYTDGRLTQIDDPAGSLYRYEYDQAGNLSRQTDALGNSTLYTYDEGRRLTTLTDAEGIVFTTNTYDTWNRVTRQVDGRGGVLSIRYADIRSVAVDPMGNPTVYHYDRYQRLVGLEDALRNRTYVIYDANDNVVQVSDRLGNVTSYAYDARGNVVRITDPLGHNTLHTYDAQDNRTSTTDRLDATTLFAWDAHRNLVRLTDALGNVTSYAYDGRGLLTTLTDANGHRRMFSYDGQGNLTRSADALGHASTMTYDELGRLLSETDPLGNTREYAYDPAGRLLRETDPLENATSYSYNRAGLLLSETDARGSTTSYSYDAQYNLSTVTDALGGATHYERDLNGRLIALTDANGHTTRHEYDALTRLVQITDPLGREVRLDYNANDWPVSRTKADGHVVSYEYDRLGRLTRTTYHDGTATVWAYDAEGRVADARHGSWQAQYTYDLLGRPLTIDLAEEGVQVAYSYDAAGNRLGVTAVRGSDLLYDARYAYDAADRLTDAADALVSYAVSYSYNDDDALSEILQPSGVRTRYTRDADGRITRLEHLDGEDQVLAALEYVYDAAGNVVRASGDSSPTTYDYDALDRLIRESGPAYSLEYAYDAVGNRTRLTDPQGAVSYSYDAADQLLSAGAAAFTYDANGNQTGRRDAGGAYALAYDDRDQLIEVVAPGGARTSFRYDISGRRIAVQSLDGSRSTIYDGASAILIGNEELDEGQAYLWGAEELTLGRPLRVGGARATSYLGDRMGNVIGLLSADGVLGSVLAYDPFGNRQAQAGGDPEPFLFQGVLGVEAEPALSGVYVTGLRYYDAAVGRFLTRDLLSGTTGQPQTQNEYVYALNNPLRYVDPWGLYPSSEEEWAKWKRRTLSDLAKMEDILQGLLDGRLDSGTPLLTIALTSNWGQYINSGATSSQMQMNDTQGAIVIQTQMATEPPERALERWKELQTNLGAARSVLEASLTVLAPEGEQ